MRLEHRRLFGLENEFYKVGLESSFNDLSRAVCESGFDDFSPEGVTSFLSFRYPILHDTMFAGFKRSDEYRRTRIHFILWAGQIHKYAASQSDSRIFAATSH